MKVRFGVIGAGGVARRRTIPEVLAFARHSEIVACMDVNPQALEEISQSFGITRATTSLEELLGADIDAVYIASPVAFHYKQAMQALSFGKHVLCEKPFALTLCEAEEMTEKAEKEGLKLGVAFMMRYNVYHQKIKEWIEEGRLGQLVAGRAQLSCFYPPIPSAWRQKKGEGGGGAFMDMGCHCVDLLEWFFGETREVFAFMDTLIHDYEVEDTSSVLLKFASGAQAFVDNYFNVPDRASKNALEIYGTKGAVLTHYTIGQEKGGMVWYLFEEEVSGYDALQKREETGWQMLSLEPKPLYAQEVDAFSRWILFGEKPLISYEVGLRNMRVVEAVYRSSAMGKPVRV